MAMIEGPFIKAEDITDTDTTHAVSQAVYIGVAEQMDLYINGAWVAFGAPAAGTIVPVKATGARDSGDAAPSSGQIIFLR